MRFRPAYFLFSGVLVVGAIFSIARFGFLPSIDFVGGSVTEYRFSTQINPGQIREILQDEEALRGVAAVGADSVVLRTRPIAQAEAESIAAKLAEELEETPQLIRFENVGPALSREILTKTFVAIAIAAAGILAWVAWQFKSIKFGVSAVLAMLHDSTILLGAFSLLGYALRVEVDLLFVTAVLTTLSFSVHDTIVVYDRIREAQRNFPQASFLDLANKAINETMVRSINNSLTIVFMLVALLLLGGETIKWFVGALLVGTIAGTYSSPFVAVPILVSWDELQGRLKRPRR